LAVGPGKLFFDIFSFCWDDTWALRGVSKQGTTNSPKSYNEVALLTKGFAYNTINCMTTDNLNVYWSENTGAIRCIPQVGGPVTTLEMLNGIPNSLVTPTTGRGGGKMFWLEINPGSTVDLKQGLGVGKKISPTPMLHLLLLSD
jgi:hypothetical protein